MFLPHDVSQLLLHRRKEIHPDSCKLVLFTLPPSLYSELEGFRNRTIIVRKKRFRKCHLRLFFGQTNRYSLRDFNRLVRSFFTAAFSGLPDVPHERLLKSWSGSDVFGIIWESPRSLFAILEPTSHIGSPLSEKIWWKPPMANFNGL